MGTVFADMPGWIDFATETHDFAGCIKYLKNS